MLIAIGQKEKKKSKATIRIIRWNNLEVQYEIFHLKFVINEICEWDLFLWGVSRGHVVGTRFKVGTEAVAGEVD